MIISIQFITLVIATILSYCLGFLFTETKYDLSKYKLFQFKAFECRKCLSFHICWVLNTFLSLAFNSIPMLITGIIFAIILYIGLYIDEKERFKKK